MDCIIPYELRQFDDLAAASLVAAYNGAMSLLARPERCRAFPSRGEGIRRCEGARVELVRLYGHAVWVDGKWRVSVNVPG
jgi:hypothetical protein